MPSDPVKAFSFLFYLQITSGTETRKERSSQMRKGRKRGRKYDSQMQRPNPSRSGEIAPSSLRRRVLSSRRQSLSFSISLSLLNRVWSSQHCADRDLAFTPITIVAPRRAISTLVKPSRLSLFLFLSIWPDLMIFFSGFCLCFYIKEWMILYICLAAEKMWVTSRKYVFYSIFKNTTKYHKIFFKTFFEMQPNTWKYFLFPKIAFPKNIYFSENILHETNTTLVFVWEQLI